MPEFQLFNTTDIVTTLEKNAIAGFLDKHLGEYNDTRENVLKAVEYALSKFPHQGGFLILSKEKEQIIGAAVVNKTNMEGYFPENILVYFAVHEERRGEGQGTELIKRCIQFTKGDLMVRGKLSAENKKLLTNLGFENPYQEFILKKK